MMLGDRLRDGQAVSALGPNHVVAAGTRLHDTTFSLQTILVSAYHVHQYTRLGSNFTIYADVSTDTRDCT